MRYRRIEGPGPTASSSRCRLSAEGRVSVGWETAYNWLRQADLRVSVLPVRRSLSPPNLTFRRHLIRGRGIPPSENEVSRET